MTNKPSTGFVLGALVALYLGMPTLTVAQGLTLSGYTDFEVIVNNVDADEKDFYFDNHHFNLIMVGSMVDNLFAAFEIEYEHAGEEIAMEYGYFGYTGLKTFGSWPESSSSPSDASTRTFLPPRSTRFPAGLLGSR